MIDRRRTLAGALGALLAACADTKGSPQPSFDGAARLEEIERRAGGRLGAYVFDSAGGRGFGWRANERFAHCSSFKLSLAAMLLAKAERGEVDSAAIVRWTSEELLPTSPVTKANVAKGLSLERLAHATLVTSDNTAANLLLRHFGGPQKLTEFWRSLGDSISRLDRYELELNLVPPGTELDTTTPAAMASTVSKLLMGNVLSAASRATLKTWLTEVKTGLQRIRAGFPPDWESGDKTGTSVDESKHTYVDLAFGGPRGRAPLIVAAYFEPVLPASPMAPASLAVLADVGRVAAASLEPPNQGM